MAEKIDYRKELKELYQPPAAKPVLVEVPPMNFLMIDGHGDPNTSAFYADAVSALFSLAYGIKFAVKKAHGVDFGVLPAEGLWWSEQMEDFSTGNKDNWDWTMMIMQPDPVSSELVEQIRQETIRKKGQPLLEQVRFERFEEGPSAQLMHIGPFSEEGPNIARLHQFIIDQGCELRGKHHEIYLSDMRKTAPQKLKTVVRQPLQRPG